MNDKMNDTQETPQAVELTEDTLSKPIETKGSKNWFLVGTLVTICLISIGLIVYLLFNNMYPTTEDADIDSVISQIDGFTDDLDLTGIEELDGLLEPEDELDLTLDTLDQTLEEIEGEADLGEFDDPGQ